MALLGSAYNSGVYYSSRFHSYSKVLFYANVEETVELDKKLVMFFIWNETLTIGITIIRNLRKVLESRKLTLFGHIC